MNFVYCFWMDMSESYLMLFFFQGGGMHLGSEYSNQIGTSMQADRGSWMSGPPETSSVPQLSGPPSLVPGQMPGSQPGRGTSVK